VNKQKTDEKISDALEELCKKYCRLKLLEDIHPTPKVKVLIAEAYILGIKFARYATYYCLRSSLGKSFAVCGVTQSYPALLTPFTRRSVVECNCESTKRL